MKKFNDLKNTFKTLAIFLTYPEQGWLNESYQLYQAIQHEKAILTCENDLQFFIKQLQHTDLFTSQVYYVSLFDQTPSLSLHLFEHVHGESRERGKAMIDLIELYESHQLKILNNELPDYLPLFLEYLSLLNIDEALNLLKDVDHILLKMTKDLIKRNSYYAIPFNILLKIAGNTSLSIDQQMLKRQEELISFVEVDRTWQEAEVTFMGNNEVTYLQNQPHNLPREYKFNIKDLK